MLRSLTALILCAGVASCGRPAVQVAFSPRGGVAELIASEIGAARGEVLVAMFAFTRGDLRDALIEAHRRGVRVRVKMDRTNAEHPRSAWRELRGAGIPVAFSTGDGKMHHKYCVVDRLSVLTGSYNWLDSAEVKNRENLVVLSDADAAAQFAAEWERLPADDSPPSAHAE